VTDTPERTLVLIKPDAVGRGLVGEVLDRLERKGLRLRAINMRTLDRETAQEHYAEHVGKPFFDSLINFITSGPLVAAVAEGPRAIETWRAMMGPTDPVKAPSGTIRGDFGLIVTENLVHGSDSPASAAREVALFFPDLPA
jgi:nucleoside-diphosphate kinase